MLKFLTPTKLLRTKSNARKQESPTTKNSSSSSTNTRSSPPDLVQRRWGSVLSTFWHRGSDVEVPQMVEDDASSSSSRNSLSDEEVLSPHLSLKRVARFENDSEDHFKISSSFAKKLKSQESCIAEDQIIDVVGMTDSHDSTSPHQSLNGDVIQTPQFEIVSFPPPLPSTTSTTLSTFAIETISKRHRHLETMEKRIRRREIELIKYNEHINSLKRSAPELWSNRRDAL